ILKPGFTYNASSSATFRAWINTSLVIPVTTISNPKPGDTTGSSTDGTYQPGGSFGNDPLTGINGMTSNDQLQNSSGGTQATAYFTTYAFPIAWFKTVPATNNLNGYYIWKDVTGNNAKMLKYSSLGAGHGDEYQVKRDTMRTYNFNPAMYLPAENLTKEILISKSNLSQSTVIGVWGSKEDLDKNNFVFAINGRRNEGIVFSKQWVAEGDASKSMLVYGSDTLRSLVYNSRANVLEENPNRFHERSLRVASYYRSNKPDNSLWGETQQADITLGGKYNSTNVNNTSTYPDSIYQKNVFKGYSPELLVFNHQLKPAECNKYETYLAIKYGISLDKSYIAPNGQIIWDYDTNKKRSGKNYNNRITGFGREDAIGLYQKVSTTSYEEAPYYSNQTTYDTFDGNNSYNPSSRYRLLVMGYQQGNTPCNGSYILFGDNNDSLRFVSSATTGVTNQLNRQWLLTTNQSSFPATNKTLHWNSNSSLSIASDYKTNIFKKGSLTTLSAVTLDTLQGRDGYFAWTVEQEYGPVIAKFGTNQASLVSGSYDYGYKIDSIGRVFPIIQGQVGSVLFNIEKVQRIEIEKNEQIIYLRVNGVRYKNTEISILAADYAKTYYGAISIGSNPYDVQLTNFRHGGFVDTGSRIELSYFRIPQLAAYVNGQTNLIIDRTGNGNFGTTSDVYACDEIDTLRAKIIFNNVFWDTDGNGRDAFTFGYKTALISHVKSFDIP
ncbi:MAG: hypothetical protein Q8909_20145, partial [Bacteroidota bacterium]|nr:hypothetical protein [Bacteroidota bacterium]